MSTYIQLGTVRLDLPTYLAGFSGRATYAYSEHQIIEGKSHLQWTGDGLQTRSLTANLHASFCDPQREYQKLTAAAKRHEALKLFFVRGIFEGDYVITSIERTLTQTDALGVPYAMTLQIELQECVVPRESGPAAGILGTIGKALGMPPEQVVGTALAIASDPEGFAKATVKNYVGDTVSAVAERFGPLGPVVEKVYSVMARQKVDELLR